MGGKVRKTPALGSENQLPAWLEASPARAGISSRQDAEKQDNLALIPGQQLFAPSTRDNASRGGSVQLWGCSAFGPYTVELCGGMLGIGPFYWSGCCSLLSLTPRSNSALACLDNVNVISREMLVTMAKLGSGAGRQFVV